MKANRCTCKVEGATGQVIRDSCSVHRNGTGVAPEKKCSCGEPHISARITHRYDGKPCYVTDSKPAEKKQPLTQEPKASDDTRKEVEGILDYINTHIESYPPEVKKRILTLIAKEKAKARRDELDRAIECAEGKTPLRCQNLHEHAKRRIESLEGETE